MSEPIELIDWGEEEDDAINVPTDCAVCGRPATGFAMINDRRYCHPDHGPSCYMGQTLTDSSLSITHISDTSVMMSESE